MRAVPLHSSNMSGMPLARGLMPLHITRTEFWRARFASDLRCGKDGRWVGGGVIAYALTSQEAGSGSGSKRARGSLCVNGE